MSNPKQRTASERITDLEDAFRGVLHTMNEVSQEIGNIKYGLKLLNNKIDAVIEAAKSPNGITADSVDQALVQGKVNDLKSRLDDMVSQKVLTSEESVTESSFVVGQEVDKSGKVVNPRIQFPMNALEEDVKSKIVGAKPGDLIHFSEEKLSLLVTESYSVSTPKPTESENSEEAAQEAVSG